MLDVHRRYVDAGCDVISTDTWSILSAPEVEQRARQGGGRATGTSRDSGIQLARQAIAEAGCEDETAVAFTISEEVNVDKPPEGDDRAARTRLADDSA